jgi:hypothetical protein
MKKYPHTEKANLLSHIKEFTIERKPMFIKNVGTPLAMLFTLLNLRKSMLARTSLNVRNVERPLVGDQA